MKSEERPWALTKEVPARKVKKDHEGPKRREKKSKKEEDPDLGHERDLHHPGSKSFERKPIRS